MPRHFTASTCLRCWTCAFRAIFGTTDGPLSTWLGEQVHWFVKLVRQELLQDADRLGLFDTETPTFEAPAMQPAATQTPRVHACKFRLGLVDLVSVIRQAHSAAWALRRVNCFFFPAAAITFDRYVIAVHRQMLEDVAVAFAQVSPLQFPKFPFFARLPKTRVQTSGTASSYSSL